MYSFRARSEDGDQKYQAFPEHFQRELERESWALYSLGIFFIVVRMYARIRKLGLRGLQIDDYLMLSAAAWYTIMVVTFNLMAQGGGSALAMPGEDVMLLTEYEIKIRTKGAKIGFVAEQAMLNVIWTLKACMLLLYSRLTMGLKQRLGVKILAVYVLLGWVACQITLFAECIPFKQYWQIAPSPSKNCMVYYDFLIVQGITNISSDIFMLLIPLPLVLSVMVPIKQKAVLLVIFSMGIFVIVAALITKIEYFISIYDDSFMFWYTREASVAVYVANLPCIWPLLREGLPVLRSWTPGWMSSALRYRTGRNGTSALTARGGVTTRTNVTRRSLEEFRKIGETSAMGKTGVTANVHDVDDFERTVGGKHNSDKDSDVASDELPFQGIRAETTIELSVLSQTGSVISSPRAGSGSSVKSNAYSDVGQGSENPHSRI